MFPPRLLVPALMLSLVASLLAFDSKRFPGPYCATRQYGEQCCKGRDDECTVPIHDTLCYCDEFCYMHSVEDCCPDFEPVCRGKPDPVESDCRRNGTLLNLGESYMSDECNKCTCTRESGPTGEKHVWRCTQDACINEQTMIDKINIRSLGWRAKAYKQFDGMKLLEGIKYFLGTQNPSPDVVKLHPITGYSDFDFPLYFDSRTKWHDFIHPPLNQGRCASSWAFSTAGVATDRWAIQSNGTFNSQLSVQQLLDCNRLIDACQPGRVEHAWWMLQRQGLVQDSCYQYTGRREICKLESDIVCPSNEVLHVLKTTPPYRIARDEKKIMYEIYTNGPVQAIMQVKADFFLYGNGIYRYSREPEYDQADHDHTLVGTHSVKIIGWGEDNRYNKYWLAMNSWGTTWGENGLFRIGRGENESGIEDFVVGVWPRTEKHALKEERKHRHAHKHRL